MISDWEGAQLLSWLGDAATPPLAATFVPVNCVEQSETRPETNALCAEAVAADVRYVERDQVDGGAVLVGGGEHEFLLGEFGYAVTGGVPQ